MRRFLLGMTVLALMSAVIVWPTAVLAQKPVKLGFAYIMSGPLAVYGEFAKNGALLAIDEINKAGGIDGRKIEAVYEDESGKPDVAIRVVRKLVYENEVDVVIGLDSSGSAAAVGPLMKELATPLIVTHAATPEITGKKCCKYTFRISLSEDQNMAMAATIASEMKAKTWTTIAPDYEFGYQSWEFFQKYLKAKKPGVTFSSTSEAAFAPTKTTDFSPYISKVMNAKPEGVFISLWGGNLIDFVRQAADMGFFDGKFDVLMSLGAATEVLTSLKEKMPVGVWVGTRYWFLGNDTPENKAFVNAYKERYNVYPSYNAHGAYAAVNAYAEAVKKAGSTDKEKIVKALEGLSLKLPVGQVTIRPEDHQAVTDGIWGKTAADPNYPIRILKPTKSFLGKDITPPVEETGCKMQ